LKVKLAQELFFNQQLLSLYKISNKSFIGEFKSAFKGIGIDFNQNRIFSEKDSVRQINWNIFAKTRSLYVKEYIEDRNRFNIIALDISKSMFQKFSTKTKIEVALEAALVLFYSSLKVNDNTSLILFDNKIRYFFPFNRKLTYFFKVLNILKTLYIELNNSENIAQFIRNLYNILQKRCQIFLISDFSFEFSFELFSFLNQKSSIISIIIIDKEEEKLSNSINFFSSNERPDIYSQIPYHQIIQNSLKELEKANIEKILIRTDSSPYIVLQNFFENRIKNQY